jgi:hypothetical protein
VRRVLVGALLPLVLAGCGLPLEDGVRRPGPAVQRAAQPGEVDVVPPPPRADADAVAVVEAFVDAQTSPRDDHGAARAYLAEGTRWDDDEALVFSSRGDAREVSPGVVTVTYEVEGRVRADGTWAVDRRRVEATYRLVRRGSTWRLTSVPPGLQLSVPDRDRSFRQRSVHFLAERSPDGPLVAEPVFQPVGGDAAQALVQRLLRGPSRDLAPAVRSAVPAGTALAVPVRTDGGTVSVDLGRAVGELPAADLRRLSAQLVWTLRGVPGFSALRLLADGRPVEVDGRAEQGRDDWDERDPDGLVAEPAVAFVQARALRTLVDGAVGVGASTAPVDEVAVSPLGDVVALLSRSGATTTVRTGPLAGPTAVRARLGPATSPTWGSGVDGLWLLDRGQVRVLPPEGGVRRVGVEGGAASPPLTALAVSRDGARVALVRGGSLLVGRVQRVASGPEAGSLVVAGLRPVAPALRSVVDVAWRSATSLVALARTGGGPLTLPVDVAVDGSRSTALSRSGLGDAPTEVGAARRSLLVVAGGRLYRDTGQFFEEVRGARGAVSPAFPG